MFRIVLFAAVGFLAYVLYKRIIVGPIRAREEREEEEHVKSLVQDPHCHTYVDSREAVRREVPGGELFFCSKTCAKAYLEAHTGA
jgi:YHS domain-containing protein